jgi:eukaryotic-like serine/threonine-protein kinase
VPIDEIGEHDGQHFFSMGFVEGTSLAAKVADGPLPPREAAALTSQIAQSMHDGRFLE